MSTRKTEQLNSPRRRPNVVLVLDRAWAWRRAGALALAGAAAIGLAACGGSRPSHVASLATTTASTESSTTTRGGSNTTTSAKGGNPTKLVDEWATCMRRHGDPSQVDPVIDTHGVINISIRTDQPVQRVETNGIVSVTGPPGWGAGCGTYLAAAQRALRAEDPVQDPGGVTNSATIIAYATCMRANGISNYPYPSGPNDTKANFNGTGINLNSPKFTRANDYCGKKVGLPTWWINGWGPPGDVSVQSGPNGGPGNGPSPPNRPRVGNGGSSSNAGSGAGG